MIQNLCAHTQQWYQHYRQNERCDPLTAGMLASRPYLMIGATAAYLIGSSLWNRPGWRTRAAVLLTINQAVNIAQTGAMLSLYLRQIADRQKRTHGHFIHATIQITLFFLRSATLLKYVQPLDPSSLSSTIWNKIYKSVHYVGLILTLPVFGPRIAGVLWSARRKSIVQTVSEGLPLSLFVIDKTLLAHRGPTPEVVFTWPGLLANLLLLSQVLYDFGNQLRTPVSG